jgi:isopentenyldiphosphate isomerase
VKQKQKLIVQKRTDTKDYCPGHWDACTGGVIQEGEEYHEACNFLHQGHTIFFSCRLNVAAKYF